MPVTVVAKNEFDFIVIGGGTAGCAVAGRLAGSPDVSVLLIKAGKGKPNEVAEITTPARAFELRGSEYDWSYKATMIDNSDHTWVDKPTTRGKILGGSSCVYCYTWIRGSKATFDDWAEFDGDEWTWETTKQYFDNPATYHDDKRRYSPGLQHIGTDGVSHSGLLSETAAFRNSLKQAWTSKGEEITEDVFSGTQASLFECVNSIYGGTRSSSSTYPEGKENVFTLAETMCKRLIIKNDEVSGVEALLQDGQKYALSEV